MNNPSLPRLFVTVPVLNESVLLWRLMHCISRQTYRYFKVLVCVNQPDEWWDIPGKRAICESNVKVLNDLARVEGFPLAVIDRCSRGNGWKGKRHGVGYARKTVMDAACDEAGEKDIILSMDADTTFSENYFLSVAENFNRHPEAVGLAVPYFHRQADDKAAWRAILRYEIYMRHYSLNLWRISSPYTFTALGSAMACPAWAYRAVGGLTPKMSGEDFYFLQKLRKYGNMLFWNEEKVYPEARFSDRVYFGTGPAMIKGREGDWSGYPIYSWQFFDEIGETTRLLSSFFKETASTRVVEFLQSHLKEEDPFLPLRENFNDPGLFVRACHEKLDGLRILQYLKYRHRQEPQKDEISLGNFLQRFYQKEEIERLQIDLAGLSFERSSLEEMERIRMFLVRKEEEYQVTSTPS